MSKGRHSEIRNERTRIAPIIGQQRIDSNRIMNSNTTLDRFKSSEETMAGIVSHRSSGTPNAPTPSDSSMRRNARVSCFDVSVMPTVRKRELHAFSVHFSVSTSKWIATLARPCEGQKIRFDEKRRCTSFSFSREREARRFAKVYTPPKMMTEATKCVCCSVPFNDKFFHCRNCGAQVCNTCSTRWGIRMIPKTYVTNPNASLTVRVCKSCNWLSNAFCMALLQGNYEQAMSIHGTGNVNLRTSFADIKKEAMFPVHCAVSLLSLSIEKVESMQAIGSLDLLNPPFFSLRSWEAT